MASVISLEMNRLDFPPAPRRTWFTNLAGAAAILAGGPGSLFSAFALLMAIGKPYANSSADPLGIFLIFILPPVTLLAGICLLLRHRWARWWMVFLAAGVMGTGVKGLLVADSHDPEATPEAAEAVGAIARLGSAAATAAGGLALAGFFCRSVRREFGGCDDRPAPAPDRGDG